MYKLDIVSAFFSRIREMRMVYIFFGFVFFLTPLVYWKEPNLFLLLLLCLLPLLLSTGEFKE